MLDRLAVDLVKFCWEVVVSEGASRGYEQKSRPRELRGCVMEVQRECCRTKAFESFYVLYLAFTDSNFAKRAP